jgi:hypothetical protein
MARGARWRVACSRGAALLVPGFPGAAAGTGLEHQRVDSLAFILLLLVVLVLCVASSCMEEAEDNRENFLDNRENFLGEESTPRAKSPRPRPRARERSPIWRGQLPET